MKILCAEYNSEGEVVIIPMGDDVLLRNNEDFYIPEFTSSISCVPQLVVKICKLGKSVNVRFAGRYYDEVGVGIRFYADSLEQELHQKGLPAIVASSFAGSAAISPMISKNSFEESEYLFKVNGKCQYQEQPTDWRVKAEQLIALASEYHTLKIGDFLFCGNIWRYYDLKLGDRMEMEGKLKMDFYLK